MSTNEKIVLCNRLAISITLLAKETAFWADEALHAETSVDRVDAADIMLGFFNKYTEAVAEYDVLKAQLYN